MKSSIVSAPETGSPNFSQATKTDVGLKGRDKGVLPIVGLAGSTSGISALQEFFAAMPIDSGMAFVVILHLSPIHESTVPETLQRSTTMKVLAATDGARIEPNCVYVISPGNFFSYTDGCLHLTHAEESHGKLVAVDYFFRAMAEAHGAQSIAVVLSGAGGDGALGLKRVKELGGLTIAQDPNEAEYPEMPRSAISTAVVDWVLGVTEMPAKILAYMKQREEICLPRQDAPTPDGPMERSPDEQDAVLQDVLAFLHSRTGRDFSYYKRATVVRRIARRMQMNGLRDLPDYLTYLRTHAGEAGALLQDLLISVTNFFRDPDSFTALERTVPELFKGKGVKDTVRVWVAGCATGEEAYSIGMLLSEYAAKLASPPQLQIFATDLDEEVIREAREGFYPETIAADISEERLRHFFTHEHGGYRVRRPLRDLVLFVGHDLLKDSPFSRLDLVSCRNLLIYLNREAQSRALDIFHFALRPGGQLFLGTSESVDDGNPLFGVLDKKERLYVQRPGPQRPIPLLGGQGMVARALAFHDRNRKHPSVAIHTSIESGPPASDRTLLMDRGLSSAELHYRLIERFSAPSILINSSHEIVHLSESAGRFLHFAGGAPTRNLLSAVHPMLRLELRAALYVAARTHIVATAFRVPLDVGTQASLVDIRVTPAGDLAPDYLLVVFEEHPAVGPTEVNSPKSAEADHAAMHLERELMETKVRLQETIEDSEASHEELRASNEELQAMNEELRSATEELETSREELRSINDELKNNIEQLARSNNDLQNLMAATDIATIFLDREQRIQRFTPSAQKLFNLISTDIGRPLSDLSGQINYPEMAADAKNALEHLQAEQREVRAGERCYMARTHVYRTTDDQIAGVVITFTDITSIKKGEEATARLAAIVESSSDAILGKDLQGIVTSWNRGAQKMFGYTAAEMIGQPVARLIPAERQSEEVEILRKIGAGETIKSFDTVRVHKDGRTIPVSATISPIKDAAGRIIGGSSSARDISVAKSAEAALHQSEERSAFVRRSSGVGFWYCDLPFDVLQWDDLVKSHFHLPPDAPVTIQTFYDRIHPDDRDMTRRAIEESIERRTPYKIDYRTVNPDSGAVTWVRAIGRTFYSDDGKPIRFDGVTLDVSEQKWAEEGFRESQQRLESVLHSIDDGLVVINRDWRYTYFSEKAALIAGVRREDMLGKVVGETHPYAKESQFYEEYKRSLSTGEPVHFEEYCPDPINKWLECHCYPSADGLTVYFRDVTDRKQREHERDAIQRTLAALIDRCPFGIYIVDSDLRFTIANTGSQTGAFRNVYPLIGRPFEEVMNIIWPAPIANEVLTRFRHTLETGEPYISNDFVGPRADIDQTEGYEWELHRIDLPDGKAGVVCYYYDATKLRQVEQALREADRRKDVFLATLAHELRNPLAPIRNGLEIIRMTGSTGTIEQARSMMERQLTQMIRLVDDLLDASRVTSGKLELRTERVDLRAVIEAAVETSRPVIKEARHNFATTMPDKSIWVDGDVTRLAQVVSNLLNNSAKYTPPSGNIRLTVALDGDMAIVSVADDGIGIPPAMLGKVFEMFTQVDRALEKTTGGLGIGLSLVKGLVEMHGGTIEARSEGEGRGSEFVVRLPVVSMAGHELESPKVNDSIKPSFKRRILVADDNVDSAESLCRLLELLGNDVSTANDGLEALEIADTFRPDLILLDIGMPKLNGYETCRRIREQPWSKDTILVALTGWGQDEDKRMSEEAGFDHHIVKPVDPSALEILLAGLQEAN